eukprot:Em0019g1050a
MELKDKQDWKSVIDNTDTFLFDCDGVLWTGNSDPVPGAQEAVRFLQSQGKAVYFVSNNSSQSRKEYISKFQKLGFHVNENEIFCTSYVTAYYLKHVLNFTQKVYLIGMEGFAQELNAMGLSCIGPGNDPINGTSSDWLKMPIDLEVGAVVVGFDSNFSYMKLIKAVTLVNKPGCIFIATNEDSRLPAQSDVIIPGTGCFVAAVQCGAEREPILIGKPHKPMFMCIRDSTHLDPARTVMVGDRMNTDVLFGKQNGLKTILTFTGITQRSELASAPEEWIPDYLCASVGDLLVCRD